LTRDFSTRPRRASPVPATLWIAGGTLVLVLSTAWAIALRRDAARAEATLAAANADLGRAEDRVRELQSAKYSTDDLLAAQIVGTAQAAPAMVLAELQKLLPADVRLTGITVTYGRTLDVDMQIQARRPDAYDEFLARLGRQSAFHDISPGAESREGVVQATVKARFGGAP